MTSDVSRMTLAEIQAELRSYRPALAEDVILTAEHIERRALLWRRLDALVRSRDHWGRSTPRPWSTGKQE
jgi:hypothetical protein